VCTTIRVTVAPLHKTSPHLWLLDQLYHNIQRQMMSAIAVVSVVACFQIRAYQSVTVSALNVARLVLVQRQQIQEHVPVTAVVLKQMPALAALKMHALRPCRMDAMTVVAVPVFATAVMAHVQCLSNPSQPIALSLQAVVHCCSSRGIRPKAKLCCKRLFNR
jgi:hypothetical protein